MKLQTLGSNVFWLLNHQSLFFLFHFLFSLLKSTVLICDHCRRFNQYCPALFPPERNDLITRVKQDFISGCGNETLGWFIGTCRCVTVLLCRFNEMERLLKEVQAAHVSLTKQTDTLKKNHEALQLQQNKCATHTHTHTCDTCFLWPEDEVSDARCSLLGRRHCCRREKRRSDRLIQIYRRKTVKSQVGFQLISP